MSDHVWVSQEGAGLTARLFRVHAKEVEHLAAQLPGDRLDDLKAQALACSGALARIADQLEAVQGPVRMRGEALREIGENTRQGLRRMAGNRGPH